MDTSYLSSQVTAIITQLHGLFDDIGVPSHERDSRETELFNALSETLQSQVRRVSTEKQELTDEAHRIIKTIKQMEASLNDPNEYDHSYGTHSTLKVTTPLIECVEELREKLNTISKLHRERFEQVKKLVVAVKSYSSHFEPSFVKIALPPTDPNATLPPTFNLSPSYFTDLDSEFSRVYEEYTRRVALIQGVSEEIIKLWAELGTPQAQTDSEIVKHYRDAPEQLGLRQDDITRLTSRRDKLIEEKKGRERKLREIKQMVEHLWDRLEIGESERKGFTMNNRGCGLRVINEYEDELARLNELKRQNMHVFVEDARCRLQELWDGLYFSEEEMLEFTPAFSDVYSDALLSAHEAEIDRLQALAQERKPILDLIDKHKSLIKDRDDLAAASQDATRLLARPAKGEKRDPTRLLREEKMRKRIAKDLPKVEVELRKILEAWEEDYGRSFLVQGERYLDDIAASQVQRNVPARAKTPVGPARPASKAANARPTAKPAQPAARNPAPRSAPSRAGAKTPVAPTGYGTMKRVAAPPSAVSTAGNKSPSRIPRGPLTHMPHGNNSPTRMSPPKTYDNSTMKKMGPPPPKMRDIMMAPPPRSADPYAQRSVSGTSSSSGSVRPVSPEDMYVSDSSYGNSRSGMMQALGNAYPPSTFSRQTSQMSAATMTTSTTMSGSDNWEAFDESSMDGDRVDHNQHYYEMPRQAQIAPLQAGKRFVPDGGYADAAQGKRPRGMELAVHDGRQLVVERHDNSWTDEETF